MFSFMPKLKAVVEYLLGVLLALALGLFFYYGGDYLDNLPIVSILITATSLYFAASTAALSRIHDLDKSQKDIADAIHKVFSKGNFPQELEEKMKNAKKKLYNQSVKVSEALHRQLRNQILLVVLVIFLAGLKQIFVERFSIEFCFCRIETSVATIISILNNSAILYAIGYSLYIIHGTAKSIRDIHNAMTGELFSDAM